MHQGIYLRYFFFSLLISLSTSQLAKGQAIADFRFEDPNNLTKNSVPGRRDAISTNGSHAEVDGDGGIYSQSGDQLDLLLPDSMLTPNKSIYMEFDFQNHEQFAWLISGGEFDGEKLSTSLAHIMNGGYKVRYYTEKYPDSLIDSDFVKPEESLQIGERAIISFIYDENEGVGYLLKNGQEIWNSFEDGGFEKTPGYGLLWHNSTGFYQVGANTNGEYEGVLSSVPTFYRVRIFGEPCGDLTPPQIALSDLEICENESATLTASGRTEGSYRWYEDAAVTTPIDGATASTYTTPALTESKSFFVTSVNGPCESDPVEIYVKVNPLPMQPQTTSLSSICGEGQATVTVSGGTEGKYLWYRDSDPASSPIPNETGSTFTTEVVSQSTTYYVSVMGENCESEKTAVEILVHPVPAIPEVEQSSFVLCGPGEAALKISNPPATDITYNWYAVSKGDIMLLHSGPESTFNVNAVSDTLIMVKASNGECESDATEVDIKVNEIPFIDAGEDITILKGESIELQAKGRNGETFSCSWYPSESLDRLDIPNPVATPETSTSYIVKRIDSLTGCESTDTLTVFVINNFPVPNAFSPNFDGVNDHWEIPNIENYPHCAIKVFNSWGNEIFSSEGYNIPWDGTFNGQELPAGSYYYTLHLSPDHEGVRGSVIIMR